MTKSMDAAQTKLAILSLQVKRINHCSTGRYSGHLYKINKMNKPSNYLFSEDNTLIFLPMDSSIKLNNILYSPWQDHPCCCCLAVNALKVTFFLLITYSLTKEYFDAY